MSAFCRRSWGTKATSHASNSGATIYYSQGQGKHIGHGDRRNGVQHSRSIAKQSVIAFWLCSSVLSNCDLFVRTAIKQCACGDGMSATDSKRKFFPRYVDIDME